VLWVKFIIGILLLPVCAGAGLAVAQVVSFSGAADTTWAAMIAGAGCWVAVYLLLPKPMLLYVFGHELTHVIWTWAMGGRVKKFRASAKGGHVVVTRNNFLISLAPYFFPLYALLVVVVFAMGDRWWGWRPYAVWFHLLLGAAYAFHVTLTWHILQSTQSDITQHGWLFSGVVIFLGNAIVLLVGIPVLGREVELAAAFEWWWLGTVQVVTRLANLRA
jgi:hypothetical protein